MSDMKNRSFVNLNVNQCKMCMPLGAVMAFKGIENSIVLLHGSQGCSTYIRRYMAAHFNEPIDIASSSLNEKGTVYGGESNLKKGLDNVIKLYNPGIIGVATTCLAETIGEDIKRIISDYLEDRISDDLLIIPIQTAGYAGTQFEGYYAALHSVVGSLCEKSPKENRINIIAGNLSPGDIRNIKDILSLCQVEYTLLPDVSETLDAPYQKNYKKIPEGGTKVKDIIKMPGSIATIEMGVCIPERFSPGRFLEEEFNVPLYRCPYPIGMKATDEFLNILSEITRKPFPARLSKERGRFIDAMIDSHKYNSQGRAVIYGEPDIVYSVCKLCMENGIKPVLACTGTQSDKMKDFLINENTDGGTNVLDDVDFEIIQKYSKELGANLLIGNSDGKIITEKEGIPLVRIGFPIHDRIGGQRQVTTGYNGSLMLLDRLTNTILENKYKKYRQNIYNEYYINGSFENIKHNGNKILISVKNNDIKKPAVNSIEEKTKNHPCFSVGACKNARMHIPVAPKCNIACNYCKREYDCVNESRPGVTSQVLTPEDALERFISVKERFKNLKVVGIAGPGDALANFDETKKSIELIKDADPDITFCLSTNGLMLLEYADEIINLGITHVTITVNAVKPEIGALIYREVNYKGDKLTGIKAAETLLENQLKGISYLASKGIICKINIVMIKGINDAHIEEVVKKVKECGAYMTNIMPHIPVSGSVFENIQLTSNRELNEMRKKCENNLMQMYHCRQCRADAIGMLENDCSYEYIKRSDKKKFEDLSKDVKGSYKFAIATRSGMLVDEHFGHVSEFYIYRAEGSSIQFLEQRKVMSYCTGSEECVQEDRIGKIINAIKDCNAVLALRVGYQPAKILDEKGIKVFQTCGLIESCIKKAASIMNDKGNFVENII